MDICYKWKYKRLKKILFLTAVSSGLAPVSHHTSLSMNRCGMLIQGNIQKSKFSHQSYEKITYKKASYLQGVPYDEKYYMSSPI